MSAFVAALFLPAGLSAQRDPRGAASRAPESASDATNFVGADLVYAQPQGDFAHYVNAAFGIAGHYIHAFDPQGVISLRAELGYLIYGSRTARQPLGGGALGLINVDVTTSNNILFGGIGAQVMAPTGTLRPYVTGTLGFTDFFTSSSVAGAQSGAQPFAESQNYSDGGFATSWGGGIYIPWQAGNSPVSIDIGVQAHKSGDIKYLTEHSITFSGTNSAPVITPVRSATDFLTYRLGVSLAIR